MAMTKKSKIFVSIILILGFATWAGVLFNVLAHDSIAKYVFIACFIATALIVKLYISATNEIQKRDGAKKTKTNYIVIFITVIFAFGYVYLSLMKGVPAALHALTSEEGNLVVTVDFKPSRYSDRRCAGGIYLKGYNYFLNNRICGIGKETWDSLRSGDSLTLFGSKSLFGFRYSKYKKLTDYENRGASDSP